MTAKDDYEAIELEHGENYGQAFFVMCEEIDRLRQKVEWNYGRLAGMERREVTFRWEIQHREDFIRRLMAELRHHGWGDFHYGVTPQEPSIVALLEEGRIYTEQFVIMQEGNIYERGSDQSGAPTEEAGASERTTTGEVPLC